MNSTERLYFQYRPNLTALQHLARLQDMALRANPQGRPRLRDKLHLTLLHIGILQEVYEEIRVVNKELSWKQYEEALKALINNTQEALPIQLTVEVARISLFGHQSRVLAAELHTSPELNEAHKHALEQLAAFLNRCGIEYPAAFAQGSRNLSYSHKLIPHITLLRAAKHTFDLDTNTLPLKLSLLPLVYK